MSDLEWAKSEVESHANSNHIPKALQILADASANLDLRSQIQDASFFEKLLSCFAGLSPDVSRQSFEPLVVKNVLRCIGNLVADNEPNRSTLISNPEALKVFKSLLVSDSHDAETVTLAHTAIKVLFNLCHDYTPAQQECFCQDLHHALIHCLDTRPPSDEGLWSLALDLLAMLVEHKRELRPSEELSDFSGFASGLLNLPLAHIDATAFLDALTVVTAYLLDEKFVQETVQHKLIDRVWLLLEKADSRMKTDREDEDEEDYDEKQYLQFQLVLSQGLADMTSLPLFNEQYDPSDAFIRSLIARTIPSSTDAQSRSPIPPAACLVLGNLITSDEVATSLAPQIPLEDIFSHLGRSNDTAFLNAASGLLRHLATPKLNREKYFTDVEYVRLTKHLYTDISLEQVQVGGIGLTRQMLTGTKPQIIALLSSSNSEFLSLLLSTYRDTTSTAVKLEMTRLVVSMFRTLQPSSQPEDLEVKAVEALFDVPVNLPSPLEPLIFTIKHAPEPGIVAIQAEAWLGLNLAARLKGGVVNVANVFSEDDELFALFSSRLGGEDGQTQSKDGEEVKDSRPAWLKEKERDNAVLLCAELLKDDGVEEGVKEKFRAMLQERNITLR